MEHKMEFRIQDVSKELELPRSTIRYWEMEFPEHVRPMRTNGGQRRYCTESIAMIEEIKKMRANGMSLAAIRRKLGYDDKSEYQNSNNIDFLAKKVADVVKAEVYAFLKKAHNAKRYR
jgi:DNA-binding transcriptional MerR regulator